MATKSISSIIAAIQSSQAAGIASAGKVTKNPGIWPVWSGSTTKDHVFVRMKRSDAVKLYHQARAYDRSHHDKGKHGGRLGRVALAVLHAMIFDFQNYASGRLDPSIRALAYKAGCCVRSAKSAINRLKALGFLTWQRRAYEARDSMGRFELRQGTNAYTILDMSNWLGWRPQPRYDGPERGTAGEHERRSYGLAAGAFSQCEGASAGQVIYDLRSDPGDGLAAALATLGDAILKNS
jgi:hypothetical protein